VSASAERPDQVLGEPPDDLDDLPWSQLSEKAGATGGPCSKVSAQIRAECTKDLCPTARLSMRSRILMSLGFSMGLMAALVLLSGSHAAPPQALRTALFGAVGWGAVMLCILLVGFAKPPGRRGAVLLRTVLAFGVPALFFIYLLIAGRHGASLGQFLSHSEHTGRAAECGVFALAIGGLSSTGVLFAWRRTDPITPRLSGALAGLVGGLGAALAVGIACPTTDALHLVFAHGLVVVAFTTLGALIGRRVLTP